MAKRQKKKHWRGRATYERLIRQREDDGLTWADLCKRSGVAIGTLQHWGQRLRQERESARQPFIVVTAAMDEGSEARVEVDRSWLSMLLDGLDPTSAKVHSHHVRRVRIEGRNAHGQTHSPPRPHH